MNNFTAYISIDPSVRFGKPCIRGTRIAITDILQWLASGMTIPEIVQDYSLQAVHVQAALNFAANRESYIKILTAA